MNEATTASLPFAVGATDSQLQSGPRGRMGASLLHRAAIRVVSRTVSLESMYVISDIESSPVSNSGANEHITNATTTFDSFGKAPLMLALARFN